WSVPQPSWFYSPSWRNVESLTIRIFDKDLERRAIPPVGQSDRESTSLGVTFRSGLVVRSQHHVALARPRKRRTVTNPSPRSAPPLRAFPPSMKRVQEIAGYWSEAAEIP